LRRKDDDLGQGEIIGRDRDVLFAAGSYLGAGWLANFLGERDNPLNRNDYIHTKFLLVDPLSDDPLVVAGSANFSNPSERINDENMLVIPGDTRVADIYFGEVMRIFDHHYARYLVKKLRETNERDPNAGYVKERSEDWLKSNFAPDSYKAKRRSISWSDAVGAMRRRPAEDAKVARGDVHGLGALCNPPG
jgi:phosphatidylserine/phosphatidylglycerophosphate/cardiolipin synthase-like enzyme